MTILENRAGQQSPAKLSLVQLVQGQLAQPQLDQPHARPAAIGWVAGCSPMD